jgi:hypothetical protein
MGRYLVTSLRLQILTRKLFGRPLFAGRVENHVFASSQKFSMKDYHLPVIPRSSRSVQSSL